MSIARNLGKDTLLYSAGKIIPAVINFASIAIFTRLLEPEAFGRYQLIITAVAFLSAVLSSWLQQSVYRYLLEFKSNNKLGKFIATFFWLLLVVTATACIVAVLVYRFAPREYRSLQIVGIVLLVSYLVYMNLQVVLQANLKAYIYSKYEIVRTVLFLFLGVALVYVNRSYKSLLLAMMITYLLLSIVLAYRLDIFRAVRHFSFDPKVVKTIYLYGFPMFFWFLGSQVLGVSDRFLLEYFRGSAEVGIYASNYNLMLSGIGLMTTPIMLAAHTNIMNPWSAGERERTRSMIVSTSYYYIMFTLPILLVTLLYGKEIASFALGGKFREGYIILPIVLLGFLSNNFALFVQKSYELEKKTKLIAGFVLAAAVLNVGLNLYFIRAYGYLGAAITTAVAYIFYLLLVSFGIGVSWKFEYPWMNLAKMGFSTICIFLILRWIKSFDGLNLYAALGGSFLAAYVFLIGILVLLRESYTVTLVSKLRGIIPSRLNYAKLK